MFWGKVFKCWKWYVGFISFSALFYAGWNISQKSWNEKFFVNLRNMGSPSFTGARNIANVKQNIKVLKIKKSVIKKLWFSPLRWTIKKTLFSFI